MIEIHEAQVEAILITYRKHIAKMYEEIKVDGDYKRVFENRLKELDDELTNKTIRKELMK